MNTKSKLKAFFDANHQKFEYIAEYEANIVFFNELLRNGYKEDLEFVIPIKIYSYADSLNQTGNYKKALEVLFEVEKDLEKLKGQSKWYNQFYEGVTFLKGVCLGRLKKYHKSNIEFSRILKTNPENDKYIDWFKSNKVNQISEFSNIFGVIGMVICLLYFGADLAGYHSKSKIIGFTGATIIFLTYTISFVWRKIINKSRLKLKKNHHITLHKCQPTSLSGRNQKKHYI